MKKLSKLALAVTLSAGAVALTATTASAEVVCNQFGECWHTHRHYEYRPEFGLVVHPDGWQWGADEHFTWHEHHGRGYWRNGVWISF